MSFLQKKNEEKKLSQEEIFALKEKLRPMNFEPEKTVEIENIEPKIQEPKEKLEEEVDLLIAISKITDTLKSLSSRFDIIETRIDELQTKKIFTDLQPVNVNENEKLEMKENGTDDSGVNPIVQRVKTVLGNGDPSQCQFEVKMTSSGQGILFLLEIIPPKHLREKPDRSDGQGGTISTDIRCKNIPYAEGISGAEAYAVKVKNYCINWATKTGVPYFSK